MEVTVYAIHFASGPIYVGITRDLPRRLDEHRRRQSPSTKRILGSFQVLHTSVHPSYAEARAEEKRLKSGRGRAFLRSLSTPRQGV